MSQNKKLFPDLVKELGTIHPITQIKSEILTLLEKIGFDSIDGPEIETEEYNFDMLNIKKTHPARQMHDTFYVQNKDFVLRTHTSPVQIRGMLEQKPPIAFCSAGKVYRKDDDSTHLPMFHQVEGIYVDENVNFTHLKSLIYKIVTSLFGSKVKIRFRPSYFPFTEPSAEADIKWDKSWLEVLGCGMVHPNVLEMAGVDTKKYSGFAFGLGVERMAMLKYDIPDLRLFFENDYRFLKQF